MKSNEGSIVVATLILTLFAFLLRGQRSFDNVISSEENENQAYYTVQTQAHEGAKAGNVNILWEISDENVELLHSKDHNGWAPIHEASRMGQLDALEMLVLHGADVNEPTNAGTTPLHIALEFQGENHPIVTYLKSNGAERTSPGRFSNEFRANQPRGHHAAAVGDVEALRKIAEENFELIHRKDVNGWAPLHESVRRGNIDAVKVLIEEHGANVNETTKDGFTPLSLAKQFLGEAHPLITYLVELGGTEGGPDL